MRKSPRARTEHQSFLLAQKGRRVKHDETKLDTRLKTKESNALQSDVDAFIARGGKITQVETGATAKATYRY